MTSARAKHERYNPGPDPADTSVEAFRSETECRYDVMPAWWWHPAAQAAMYEKWLARKQAEAEAKTQAQARAERAQLLNAKRVLDMISPKEPGDG